MRPINHAINSLLINDLQDKKFTKIKNAVTALQIFIKQHSLNEKKQTQHTMHT